jgi:hypothetical protein
MAGGINGVPGAMGGGELLGAPIPSPAPMKPTGTPGERISVLNRTRKVTSSLAS